MLAGQIALNFCRKINISEKGADMKELKPCPFCGGKASLISTARPGSMSGDIGTQSTIVCQNNECGAKIVKWALEQTWAEESAVRAWSRRTKLEF